MKQKSQKECPCEGRVAVQMLVLRATIYRRRALGRRRALVTVRPWEADLQRARRDVRMLGENDTAASMEGTGRPSHRHPPHGNSGDRHNLLGKVVGSHTLPGRHHQSEPTGVPGEERNRVQVHGGHRLPHLTRLHNCGHRL